MSSLVSVSMKVRVAELQHPGYPWPISKWTGEGQRVESLLQWQDITTKGPSESCHPCQLACQWCTGEERTEVIKKPTCLASLGHLQVYTSKCFVLNNSPQKERIFCLLLL